MLYAFIDESYTQDRYYQGAFVVPAESLDALALAIKTVGEYAEGFGVEPGAELHAHEIMSGKAGWKAIRGNPRSAIMIYKRALSVLASVPGAKMFIEGVDVARLNARYSYPEPPHRVTLRYLLECVDRYATKHAQEVTVVADEVQDQAAHALRAAAYQLDSTGGYRPSMLASVQMPITFAQSDQVPGLQAADLLVYLYRRLDAHVETNSRARAAVEQMWDLLRPIWGSVRRWDP